MPDRTDYIVVKEWPKLGDTQRFEVVARGLTLAEAEKKRNENPYELRIVWMGKYPNTAIGSKPEEPKP